MYRKRVLVALVISLLLGGIGFSFKPLIESWSMPANAGEHLIRFDMGELKEKRFVIIDSGFDGYWGHSYLILKDRGEVRVFLLLTRENSYLMPSKHHLWSASGYCQKLQIKDQVISCEDEDLYDWQKEGWKWNLEGENLSKQFSSLEVVDFVSEGHFIAIGKSSD
ncbi:hypothetical protein ACJJIW_18555 [Microbulbifer sp. JMSA004]|uniref:hypothetical protein n=1 Tax=unclassified Microbulbifer TaxID=2619833 RepID=UPI0024AD6B18|nr:hypothetical protein [Microbulbifer sp. VAAF005]WHI46964.1 hypothetical protein P0078_00910 [Microbulbifer sp. VAAF005]